MGKRFKIIDDPKEYAIESNIYFFFHHYMFLLGRWKFSKAIYKDKRIRELMPTKILKPEEYWNIDMKMMIEYERVIGV